MLIGGSNYMVDRLIKKVCVFVLVVMVYVMNGTNLRGQSERIEVKGYTLQKVDKILDRGFNVYYFTHDKTGAQVVYIQNDDSNRFFSIGFKTLPQDNTGVFHIIEHSVLEGSKRYPVKGLFEELMKSNITTFINAFTYSDKTVFPIASNNEASFINLMDVYLDSVFNPLVKENPYIFYQEGVRREFEDGKLTYNGVVFNEMSGALTPERIMMSNMTHKVFKGSFLDVESGGEPLYIPDLTYEKLIETYNRYYHPSNALIFFYGDIDIEERLTYLDAQYLSNYSRQEPIMTPKINFSNPGEDIDVMNYPAGVTETPEEDSYLSINYVFDAPNFLDRLAIQTLFLALFDDEASSIKEELFKTDLFVSMDSYAYRFGSAYIASLEFSGIDSQDGEKIVKKIQQVFKKVTEQGVDPALIRSVLVDKKFREKTIPDGNMGMRLYMEGIYSGWIYDDNPLENLNNFLYTDHLLKYSDEELVDYMKKIVQVYVLDADVKYNMVSVPDSGYQKRVEEKILDKARREQEGLSSEAIEELKQIAEDTAKYSSKESSSDEIDTLPSITVDDLRSVTDLKEELLPQVVEGGRGKYLTYDTKYDEIHHLSLYFDISSLSEEELMYLALLSQLYGRLSTKDLDLKDLNVKLNLYGALKIRLAPMRTVDKRDLFTFDVDMHFLKENQLNMILLSRDILQSTRFDEKDKISQIVAEIIDDYKEDIADSPLDYAMDISNSFYSQHYNFHSLTSGAKYISFLKKIHERMKKDRSFSIEDKLKDIQDRLIKGSKVTVGISSLEDNMFNIVEDFETVFTELAPTIEKFGTASYDLGQAKNIGVLNPQNTSYVVRSSKIDMSQGSPLEYYQQGLLVLKYLSSNYLYQHIRAEGGAYGAYLHLSQDESMMLYTISDPNAVHTLQVYDRMPSFMKDISVSEEDDFQTKISVVSDGFAPQTPLSLAKQAYLRYFKGITEQDVKHMVSLILDTPLDEKIKECVSIFSESNSSATHVIVGNEETLSRLKDTGVIDEIRPIVNKN